MRLDFEQLHLAHGQVDAPAPRVFADVADDVGELQRQTELVRVQGGRGLGLAKDVGRHFAHHAGHQMAVALQAGVVQVARLVQVHLAAFNHGLQVRFFDFVVGGDRHQRQQHRVARFAGKGLCHLGLPPGQLGRCHAGVHGVIDHVIDFAAKRIERRDGRAPLCRQKHERVIETAARSGGLLLNVFLWRHGGLL